MCPDPDLRRGVSCPDESWIDVTRLKAIVPLRLVLRTDLPVTSSLPKGKQMHHLQVAVHVLFIALLFKAGLLFTAGLMLFESVMQDVSTNERNKLKNRLF